MIPVDSHASIDSMVSVPELRKITSAVVRYLNLEVSKECVQNCMVSLILSHRRVKLELWGVFPGITLQPTL